VQGAQHKTFSILMPTLSSRELFRFHKQGSSDRLYLEWKKHCYRDF